MRTAELVISALLALAAPASAYQPVGYPGGSWGSLSRDFSGFEGCGAQGWLRQGVTWTELPGNVAVQTFAYYNWRFRSENRLYYDSQGPSLSVEVRKGFLNAGVQTYWQQFPELRRQIDQHQAFLTWYKRFDLARGARLKPFGLPFSTWGSLTRDFDGIEGNGTQGWVQQGINAAKLPGGVMVTPFAAYRWRFRSENRPYYNVHGPAVGLEFARGPVTLDIENAWRNYPELQRNETALQAYVSWFYEWDLKRR